MTTFSAPPELRVDDGLGQVGVITRAALALVPAPASVRRHLLSYPDLATMLADARQLAADGRFDAVQGAIVPAPGAFAFRLDAAAFGEDDDALLAGLAGDAAARERGTIPYADYLARLAPLESALRAHGQWWLPHPWLMTFVGDSRVEAVVSEELERLDQAADLGPLGQVVLSPIRRAPVVTPLLRLPQDELCWAFNFVRLPASDDADRLVEANTAAYGRITAAGSTLYPGQRAAAAAARVARALRRGLRPLEAALAVPRREARSPDPSPSQGRA